MNQQQYWKVLQNEKIVSRIFGFLELIEISRCEQVCSRWKNFLEDDNFWTQQLFQDFNTYSTFLDNKDENQIKLYYFWFLKKLVHQDRQTFKYDERNHLLPPRYVEGVLNLAFSLQKLEISIPETNNHYRNQILRLIVKNHPKIESFKTRGGLITDENIQILTELPLNNLSILYDDPTFQGFHLNQFYDIKKLRLLPRNIQIKNLLPLLQNSKDCLEQLELDCDNFDQSEINSVFSMLNKTLIKKLTFHYCENFSMDNLEKLQGIPNLEKQVEYSKDFLRLRIRKARYIDKWIFYKIVECKQLLMINLNECEQIDNMIVETIVEHSPQLYYVDFSWSSLIDSKSIYKLFKECKYLKIVKLLGIKQLNESCLPYAYQLLKRYDRKKVIEQCKKMQEEGRIINSYLDIEISELFDGEDKIVFEGYQYLERLDFSKCDFLPDEVLEIMKLFRKGAEFLNYYSYPIKFIFD